MLSADQVTALAPDAASFKAGRGLSTMQKWESVGGNEQFLWGEAKGSGKKPYQVSVALDEFATKCSCPSRKFPCKHALGLMFLVADDHALADGAAPPPWIDEWAEARDERSKKKAARSAAKKDGKRKDEAAAAKRKEKRSARIDDGIKQLDQFLQDLVRNGLAQPEVSEPNTWLNFSRRLVDAQAPGLAGWVRRLGELPQSGADWEQKLLHELGMLHLLLTSYRKRDTLDPSLRSELEQQVGWPVDKDDVLAGKGITDRWFVAARRFSFQDNLVTSSTWLQGHESARWALVLRFAAPPNHPIDPWPVGSTVETEMVYYPGVNPDRALPRNESAHVKQESLPAPTPGFADLLDAYAAQLAANPWRTRLPFIIAAQPVRHQKQPVLVDSTGTALPCQISPTQESDLTSLCGGRPNPLCGEWNGSELTIHSAADGDDWVSLHTAA